MYVSLYLFFAFLDLFIILVEMVLVSTRAPFLSGEKRVEKLPDASYLKRPEASRVPLDGRREARPSFDIETYSCGARAFLNVFFFFLFLSLFFFSCVGCADASLCARHYRRC